MKNLFDKIEVSYPEFNFFKQLTGAEKVHYFLEIYDIETKKRKNNSRGLVSGLNDFFDEINEESNHGVEFDSVEFGETNDRVDIMIDSEHIVIESNNLKATRHIAYKFVDSGYMIKRDRDIEKMFRKSKVSKYLRVYKIIGQESCLCYN